MVKEKKYWGAIEDNLIHTYFDTGATRIQKFYAINAVLPKLQKMAEIILKRYFPMHNKSLSQEYINDAISHLFTNARFDSDKGSVYSYLSAIIKFYFMDKIVTEKKSTKRIMDSAVDTTLDVSDNEKIVQTFPNFDEFDYEERLEKLKKILVHFGKILNKLTDLEELKMEKHYKVVRRNNTYMINDDIIFLKCIIKYFETYFLDSEINSDSLVEYCYTNLDLKPNRIISLFKKYFGYYKKISRVLNGKSKLDIREKKENLSFIQLDTPKSNSYSYVEMYNKHKRKIIKNADDIIRYQYF